MQKTSITEKPYRIPDSGDRSAYLRENFGQIADRYDRVNDFITAGLHRLWKADACRLLPLKTDATVLDLCCGTGDLSIRMASRLNGSSLITACDFSPEMLAIFKQRWNKMVLKNGQKTRLEIIENDALQLPGHWESRYDAVLIGFGLRNLVDRSIAFSEIYRVLKPLGRLIVLDTGHVQYPLLKPLFKFYINKIVPRIGYFLKPHEMYEYLPASIEEYPDQKKLCTELRQAGFENIRYHNKVAGSAVIHQADKKMLLEK